MRIKMTAPKYFPKTICCKVSGLVSNNSKVPDFNSSLNVRIQTAGIRNSNTQGANSKKGERSANPLSSILKLPLNTHRNNPLIIRNIEMTRYPIVLEKKELISRLIIDIIVCFVADLGDGYSSVLYILNFIPNCEVYRHSKLAHVLERGVLSRSTRFLIQCCFYSFLNP